MVSGGEEGMRGSIGTHTTGTSYGAPVFGGLKALGLASCRSATGTGEKELASIHLGLPPLSGFMPMNPDCGC